MAQQFAHKIAQSHRCLLNCLPEDVGADGRTLQGVDGVGVPLELGLLVVHVVDEDGDGGLACLAERLATVSHADLKFFTYKCGLIDTIDIKYDF